MSEVFDVLFWPAPFLTIYLALRLAWGAQFYDEPFWIGNLKKHYGRERKKR